jgi:poly(A) polymerase Pap1
MGCNEQSSTLRKKDTTMAMNNLVKLAIAKSLEKATKEFKAAQGTHNIDTTIMLRVKGTVTKGADTEYKPTVDIPLLPTLALVLEKAGFMREKAKELLIEAMTEALELSAKGEKFVEERVKNIEEAMEHVQEVTEALPKKKKSGSTKVEVTVEEIEI